MSRNGLLSMNRNAKRTVSPFTPALSPLRGEGEPVPPTARFSTVFGLFTLILPKPLTPSNKFGFYQSTIEGIKIELRPFAQNHDPALRTITNVVAVLRRYP